MSGPAKRSAANAASSTSALSTSRLIATWPRRRASWRFFGVGCSVFSPAIYALTPSGTRSDPSRRS